MEYGEYELEERIESFIMKRCETEQCDFKQEWHQKAEDLIKDIVCFANTVHDKDCYLVFGISDDYKIVGMTKPRRKQADIIDTLIVLSEENLPAFAMFSQHFLANASLSL